SDSGKRDADLRDRTRECAAGDVTRRSAPDADARAHEHVGHLIVHAALASAEGIAAQLCARAVNVDGDRRLYPEFDAAAHHPSPAGRLQLEALCAAFDRLRGAVR